MKSTWMLMALLTLVTFSSGCSSDDSTAGTTAAGASDSDTTAGADGTDGTGSTDAGSDATEAGDGTDGADVTDSDGADATDSSDATDATDGDHPPLDGPPASRGVTRLSTEQLRLSLPIVAGTTASGAPIGWTLPGNKSDVDALGDDGLAATLGKPDYVQVMTEDLSPSSLYVKLMDDMARDVCAKMGAADAVRQGEDRVLTRFVSADAASIAVNLRYLKLRFLGERVADDDPVSDLAAVYEAASKKSDSEGWAAVCVALLTAPAFHLY